MLPDSLYINLGWGRPTGPPACKSTSRRTFLSFSHSPLIWRFRPHLAILVNIPSPLSSLAQVRACVRTARNIQLQSVSGSKWLEKRQLQARIHSTMLLNLQAKQLRCCDSHPGLYGGNPSDDCG